MFVTGLGLSAGVGGYALAAPDLSVINADIRTDANVTWGQSGIHARARCRAASRWTVG